MSFIKYFNNSLNCVVSSKVKDAMEYSLFSGGKMLRSKILLSIVKGYSQDEEIAYPIALALEMIHTYSLIHDDLPGMDNDDLRRGRKTCHIQFDEATAILAGDALLTESFKMITDAKIDDEKKIKIIRLFSDFAGANGMIYGQILDMEAESSDKKLNIDYLKEMYKNKTGKLFAISFMIGAIMNDKINDIEKLENVGYKLGFGFQIQDDLLEVTKDSKEIGKSNNSDVNNNKMTITSYLSINEAIKLMDDCYNESIETLKSILVSSNEIINIVEKIRNREK